MNAMYELECNVQEQSSDRPETVISRAWVQPQTRQNKLFQDYWRAYFEINFSERQEGLTVSSLICDR